ncbi:Dol-P-Man:Man(5)GlcNAc(2)-PP-Dol alpha-1,3-mannosyltransferase [Psilocybe cubensis]|uniref:Dol-P-Man:Man(5)GlcNAc(2)-PP-Dol alpha-1,3-mannosyltransferase n=2 Tax=Psilocybe cubensis TaxID=181762 RepID=A0ACB8H517_PSICU|nr:Dol-P-Man:Man(5)GlcNAc(2)-PP-Dol alpha-1,3-mannosyltransferase [Psilocybe cubensis]KAH9482863.1 Dol-P-Man:Man(5)GlcNAc(2)-PP-Dol alpha-1,3-mannosyltransferase [Psilocybe cubensis]
MSEYKYLSVLSSSTGSKSATPPEEFCTEMANVKLSSAIKHLLSLRSPNALPSPSLGQLNKVFTTTFRDAQAKNAETGWLVATTCTLLSANRPSAVGQLYRFVTRSTLDKDAEQKPFDLPNAINKAALMRESALKSVIFVGVPRVILSLSALHEALDDEVKHALRTNSKRTATSDSIESIVTRGKGLWNSIYTPHADKLHDKLGSYHPDFISFIIQCYGAVLSPLPGQTRGYTDVSGADDLDQGNLSRAMGSVVGIATLRAEGGVGPQLTSHVFGLLKARTTENLSEEDKWLSSDEGTEWVIRTVDEVLDGVSAEDQDQRQVKAKL